MAKRRLPNTSNVQTHSFVKGLNKDSDFTYLQNGMWTHARNATNNTKEGDLGTLSNEESNAICSIVGFDLNLPLYRYSSRSINCISCYTL